MHKPRKEMIEEIKDRETILRIAVQTKEGSLNKVESEISISSHDQGCINIAKGRIDAFVKKNTKDLDSGFCPDINSVKTDYNEILEYINQIGIQSK